jgi:ribosomal protein S1
MTDNGTSRKTSKMKMGKMLEEYSYERPKKGMFMDGEVMQIDHDRILVDLGAKTDAVVPPKEMKKTSGRLLDDISEGDVVPVFILKPPSMFRKTVVSLQRGVEKEDWDQAKALAESDEIIKCKVNGKNKGGLLIKFGNLEGFLPASLTPTVARAPNRKVTEAIKASLIGEELYLKVIKAEPKRKKLIFSGRMDREEIQRKIYQELQPDNIRKGIVVNLVEYGAFVDLLGVDGLIHISELDWTRTEHPDEVLSLGEKIEVKIIDIDEENDRVSLSRKAVIDPIEEYALEPEEVS